MSAKRRKNRHLKNATVARPAEIKSRPAPSGVSRNRGTIIGICVFLAVITLAVFAQTLRFDFINCDDGLYVYDNPSVNHGLTARGIAAAFTYRGSDNWVPLTTISHMADCQFFGLWAGGHHLMNVLLHTASVILLFLALRQMTGAVWRSAFVAAVFAIHPLHVESVAWVGERKDVLSGLFFMLTLWAYVRHVRSPSPAGYWLVVILFALGLMSKPMLVTLPLVLLLLDFWPLKRFSAAAPAAVEAGQDGGLNNRSVSARLIVEKIPLLLLALAACIVTVMAQVSAKAVQPLTQFPVSLRIENAVVSCVAYLGQMIFPAKLAPFYPYRTGGLPLWQVLGAFLVMAIVSLAVFNWRRKRPYLLAGWLWYLAMLAPVSGLFQVGAQARADRYTYLPQIGLYLMIAWLAAELCNGWRHRRLVLGGMATVIIGALTVSARIQTSYWRNSETIWTHTLAVTSNNAFAQNDLGNALLDQGRADDAIARFQTALAIRPDYAEARNNLGNVLAQRGQLDDAIQQFQMALAKRPDFPEAHNNLGSALLQKGRTDDAIGHFQKALAGWPDFAEAHCNLGTALLQKGMEADAIAQFQQALAVNPNHPKALDNLGYALLQQGRVDDAINLFRKALEINPGSVAARNNLGTALLQKGQLDEAILQFQKALEINPGHAGAQNNLGNALLKKDRLDEAAAHYRMALSLQPDNVAFQNNLAHVAWLLATAPDPSARNGTKAVELAQVADRSSDGNPTTATALAAAYAEAGRFPDAIATAQRALQLAASRHDDALAAALQIQLTLYQAGSPFRDAGAAP